MHKGALLLLPPLKSGGAGRGDYPAQSRLVHLGWWRSAPGRRAPRGAPTSPPAYRAPPPQPNPMGGWAGARALAAQPRLRAKRAGGSSAALPATSPPTPGACATSGRVLAPPVLSPGRPGRMGALEGSSPLAYRLPPSPTRPRPQGRAVSWALARQQHNRPCRSGQAASRPPSPPVPGVLEGRAEPRTAPTPRPSSPARPPPS